MSDPIKQAKKALDTIARDEAAWSAMLALLYGRSIRDGLVDARKQAGLTQAAVAKAMGVTQPTVAEFETERYPDSQVSTLQRYARAVGCRLAIGLLEPRPAHDFVAEKVPCSEVHGDPEPERKCWENGPPCMPAGRLCSAYGEDVICRWLPVQP